MHPGTQLSTESIVTSTASDPGAAPCGSCGAPMGADQRYCLECGERRTPLSSFLRGGPQASTPVARVPATAVPPDLAPDSALVARTSRGNALTVIAGVGVLMLAMGVGVLIGRSGAGKQSSAAPQVITVGALGSSPTSTGATAAGEAAFTRDWPAGTSGYTVEIQTLPTLGTTVAAVQSAKAAAEAKGAKGVGALKSEEFSSLKAGSYVIYAGVDHTRAAALGALAGLKKSFPLATVINVASTGGASQSPSSSGGSGSGSSLTHPAPPSVLESLKSTKGKSYEEKSKNLPNVIETG